MKRGRVIEETAFFATREQQSSLHLLPSLQLRFLLPKPFLKHHLGNGHKARPEREAVGEPLV